jgi:uncharacterized protein
MTVVSTLSETKNRIDLPVPVGKVTQTILERINQSEELFSLWEMTNVMAFNRLSMTDHGIKHFQLVTDTALTMLDILKEKNVEFNLEKDHGLDFDYTQSVVLLGCVLHDIGMSVHRDGHEEYSLFIAQHLLQTILDFLPPRERIIIQSETLHAIISHRSGGRPLTVEAGVVRVADALDLTRGRVKVDKEERLMDIYDVSADSIDEVILKSGKKTAIEVDIIMNHTAGLFQVDDLLKKKVDGSGIGRWLDINIFIKKTGKPQLLKQYLGSRK